MKENMGKVMGKTIGQTVEGSFYFPEDDPIYRDHFPGNAVVPGSLIMHAFMEAVRLAGREFGQVRFKNFRFKHFLTPGRKYGYRLRIDSGFVYCDVFDERRKILAEGVLGI